MNIIGLAGTNGGGKDTVGDLLAERKQYFFVSVSDLLRYEAADRGLTIERDTLSTISAEWRRQHGLGVLVDKAVELYESKKGEYPGGLVLASLRNPGEVDRVHELGGKVVWVDADLEIRYNRIFSRQRTAEDNKTLEQFKQEEAKEMEYIGDEATLSGGAVKAKADIFLQNNGSTLDGLWSDIQNELIPHL